MTDTSKDKSEWHAVSRNVRILYSLLFYSQGPVDGYLIGEKARDFFLHTGLPLPVLSQIWNLADVSNDNLLTVEEFILTMYFCHGVLRGKKLPRSLTPVLKPPERTPVSLPFLTEEEQVIYSKMFEAIHVKTTGFINGSIAQDIFHRTGLTSEQLALVWDLADINRDSRLDYGEWTIACQLIKLMKQGQSIDVPINVFTNLPERIAPGSLQAGKKRVAEYEGKKQKLMRLKERRRIQAVREKKRQELTETKITLLTQLYDVLEKTGNSKLPELQKRLAADRESSEKQKEIVFRLQKEHEKVRQDTVKIILDEQKVSNDVRQIKEQTDELYKTLRSSHSKATKDPDPFHQLFEERKGNKLIEVSESEIFSPFRTNIFSKSFITKLQSTGSDIFRENNHKNMISEVLSKEVNDEFMKLLNNNNKNVDNTDALEEDQIFKSVSGSTDDEAWLGIKADLPSSDILLKLQDLKDDFIKLNNECGQLVFKNPDDYLARKFAKEEEEKQDKFRQVFRAGSDKRSLSGTPDLLRRRSANSTSEFYQRRVGTPENLKNKSYIERNDEATQAVREYRLKRRSLHLDHTSEQVEGLPNTTRNYREVNNHTLTSKLKPEDNIKKSPERTSKKSPAPLPPSHSISKAHFSSSNEIKHNEGIKAAKSEPILTSVESFKISADTDQVIKESSVPSADQRATSPTSPTVKNPTKASVKKSRAPAPPTVSTSSSTPSIISSNLSANLSEVLKTSPKTLEILVSADTFESKPMSEIYSPNPLLSPDSLSSGISTSPPISPSDVPQRPPRTKKRNNSAKSPVSPVKPLNGDFKTENNKVEVKNISQTRNISASRPESVPRDKSVRAERPSSLFANSSYRDLEKKEEIRNYMELSPNDSSVSSPERPVRKETSTKKKAAPALPVLGPVSSINENTDVQWKNPLNPKSELQNIPTINKEDTIVKDNKEHSIELDNRIGLKPRSTFDRISISSYDSVDSIPPPLPSSAPPSLPPGGPPTEDQPISPEEIIEIEYTIPTHIALEESDDENHNRDSHLAASQYNEVEDNDSSYNCLSDVRNYGDPELSNQSSENNHASINYSQAPPTDNTASASAQAKKTVSNKRADFFDIKNKNKKYSDKVLFTDNSARIKVRNGYKVDSSDVSDTSDDESNGFEATFSPGDSGIVTSLPTSPDETDGNHTVNLISYNKRESTSQSHFLDMTSSVDTQYDDAAFLGFASKRSMFEENKTTAIPVKTLSPTSPTTDSSILSPRSRKYNSHEIAEKSRQFAEMVQRPNFTVKTKSTDSDEFSQETLQEFELNRRSVISMSTVRKNDVVSPTETSPNHLEEAEEIPVTKIENKSVKHWEVNTEPPKNRVPDIGWDTTNKQRNSIYSSNIVQEHDTTERVDRESISQSLHNTKRQWEGAFKDHIDNQFKDSKEKPKGVVRHWEVKLPNQSTPRGPAKQEQKDLISPLSNMADNESAIDREIRLANEREDLLRCEKEERLKLEEQQKGRLDISSFENTSKSSPDNKPLYHEMTEADRGSEMWQRETLIQQELREQEERELALKGKSLKPVKSNQENEKSEDFPKESIIQHEIRLQREREEELERQRTKKKVVVVDDTTSSPPAALVQTVIYNNNANSDVQNDIIHNDINHNEQKVNISYEEAISGFQHEGENLITREMRELREREEEIKRNREHLQNNNNKESLPNDQSPPKSASSNSIPNSSSSSSIHLKQGTWQKDVSPYLQPNNHRRSGSVDSLASSQSTGRTPSDYAPSRDVKVMPNLQQGSDDETTPKFNTPSSETPIKRDIRLARERENELRRSKGMPEINEPEPTPSRQKSHEDVTGTPTSSHPSRRYSKEGSGQAVRSYASNRLQQELSSQKERELIYRKEGKIITTSEEHIEPLKYKEVTGSDQVDGPVKRNYTRVNVTANKLPQTPEPNIVEESPTPPQQVSSPVKVVKGGRGAQFSYRESRQTAESKIERELREMRDREQELRVSRDPNGAIDELDSPGVKIIKQATGPDGQTRSLADQWEQICQS